MIAADEWRDIPGYDGKYQINPRAELRRVYPSGHRRMLKPYAKPGKNGRKGRILFVSLTDDTGKRKQCRVTMLMEETFMGGKHSGYVVIHKNGVLSDDVLGNLEHVTRQEAGKRYGALSKRMPVCKIDADGNELEYYSSVREAARMNPFSYQAISDHCNGKVKKPFAAAAYSFKWDK